MKRLFLLFCALLSLVNVVAQVTTASLRGVIVNSSNEELKENFENLIAPVNEEKSLEERKEVKSH